MEIKFEKEQQKLTVFVSGRIDTMTAPDLENELMPLLDGGVKQFTLDLAAVDYISSAGLRVVLKTFQKMVAQHGKMTVVNTTKSVRSVFETIGFEKILEIL